MDEDQNPEKDSQSISLTSEGPKGFLDYLPPWSEANRHEKLRIGAYSFIIYLPVLILLLIIAIVPPIYFVYYVWPMAFGGDDRPELYYWHSDPERNEAKVVGIVCLVLLVFFTLMFLVSFYQSMFTGPGKVPMTEEWQIKEHYDEEKLEKMLLVERKQTTGTIRTCSRCCVIKPDRCHHCRLCDQCVLKMDHHCPWIANCVGFFNYKYFFLMVTYGMLSLWLFTGSFWQTVVITLRDDEIKTSKAFFITLVFSLLGILSLAVLLFWCLHIYLILTATTTIEYCEKWTKGGSEGRASPYRRSAYQSLKDALGQNPLLWALPFTFRKSYEQGLFFETKEKE